MAACEQGYRWRRCQTTWWTRSRRRLSLELGVSGKWIRNVMNRRVSVLIQCVRFQVRPVWSRGLDPVAVVLRVDVGVLIHSVCLTHP